MSSAVRLFALFWIFGVFSGLKFTILFHQTCAEQYRNNWLMQVIQQLIPTEVVFWITMCLLEFFHEKD